ncbi:MAG TPA: hypothetical protein V6C58_16910 [Allocoleopsis sp.]
MTGLIKNRDFSGIFSTNPRLINDSMFSHNSDCDISISGNFSVVSIGSF